MTDYQKKRITLMRKQNVGYATIAKELRLSLGAVKQFCRRNDLQSDDLETDTQHENYKCNLVLLSEYRLFSI